MKTLLILIPAFNEEEKIGEVIENIPKKIEGVSRVDVLVVDDGSTDKTEKISQTKGAKVIRHPQNLGLGSAFETGLEHAVGNCYDILVIMDGDGQFDPNDIPKLVKPILNDEADCVTASRFIDKKFYPKMPIIKFWGNKLMSSLVSSLAGCKFYDATCGFRAYSKEALFSLNFQGQYNCSQETLLNLSFKKMRILEIPVKVKYFPDRKSKVAASIIKYTINTLKTILRTYRDYKPLVFFTRIAIFLTIIGLLFETIIIATFVKTGGFYGNIWAGFVGAGFLSLAVIFFAVGLLADMNTRIRINQEKILYLLKKRIQSK